MLWYFIKRVNKEIIKSNSVLKSNSPKDIPHPKCTKGCRNPWQNKNHRWTRIPQRRECLKFHDVGVNSQGVIVVVGADGKLYYYNFDMDTMEEIEKLKLRANALYEKWGQITI